MVSAPLDVQWPTLAEPHDRALRDAVDWILERFVPLGVVVSGSIVRGEGDAASDLDMYVIIGALERQRIQRLPSGGAGRDLRQSSGRGAPLFRE